MATNHQVTHSDRVKLNRNQVLILSAVKELNADPYSFQKPTYDNIRQAVVSSKGNKSRLPDLRTSFDKCVNLRLVEPRQQSLLCSRGGKDTYALTEQGQAVLAQSITQVNTRKRAMA